MNNPLTMEAPPLVLKAEVAEDLMTSNPVSVRDLATVQEAVGLLAEKGFSAAPVIDHAGRPVGVLSRADIITHDYELVDYLQPSPREEEKETAAAAEEGFRTETADYTRVRDIMTPVVFAVRPDMPAHEVIAEMLARHVHRLFVVDASGVLVGVISTLDVLRHLG